MSVITPNFDSLQSVLDSCKVCDSVVFLLSATQESDTWGETVLSSVLGNITTVVESRSHYSLSQLRVCPLIRYFWLRIFPRSLKTRFRRLRSSLPRA